MTSADGKMMALKTLSPIPVNEAPSFQPDNEDAASVDSFHLQLSDDEDAKKGAKEEAEEEELLNRGFDKDDCAPDPEDEDKLLNGDVTEEESASETKRCGSANAHSVSEQDTKLKDSVSVSEKNNEEEKGGKVTDDAGEDVEKKDGSENDIEVAEDKEKNEEREIEQKKKEERETEQKKNEEREIEQNKGVEKESVKTVEDKKEAVKQIQSESGEKEETKNEESVTEDIEEKEKPKEALAKSEEKQQSTTDENTAVVEEAKNEDNKEEKDVAKTTEPNKDDATKEQCEAASKETNEPVSKQPQPEVAKVTDSSQPENDHEILNDQVMDPEDLLQMVDKETDENDKDSSQSSPQNTEEATEAEKMDVDDAAKTAEETEDEKDELDVEEEPSAMESESESDTEIETAYESLAAEEIEKDPEGKDPSGKEEEKNEKEDEKVEKEKVEEKVESPKEPADVAMNASEGEATEEVTSKVTEATNKTEPENETIAGGAENKSEAPSSPVMILDEVTGETKTDVAAEDKERTASKRLLSDSEEEAAAKKMKVGNEPAENEELATPSPNLKIVALNAIDEYLKLKSLKKLTYRDLEQIILQKMCEAICHKSEIGELRHQLGVQEQMAEMWRKEVAQLTKQARDLEIVNKRLLHEVRLKNERDKPLIPVKITRSVGLQVRSDSAVMNNVNNLNKRKMNRTLNTTAAKQTRTVTPTRPQNVTRVAPQNKIITPTKAATAARPSPAKVPVSPVKKAAPVKPNTLLSKALSTTPANTTTATTSTVVSTPAVTQTGIPSLTAIPTTTKAVTTTAKTTKALGDSKTVIDLTDLTDEDDKKAITSQGIRIVSTPVKNVSTAGVVNPPRIMYVYNNQLHQGVLAADPSKPGQKLMLKLNSNVITPANGVITATVSSASAIAVSSSSIRPTSVQPVKIATSPIAAVRGPSPASKVKHPAPLPHPPPNQYCVPSRKPIPPKPHLSIKRSNGGLVLSWKMPYNLENYEAIASYQLYAYQETTSPPNSDMWRKVGDVKALALPMACTLTQFADGNKYHFAVRAVDVLKRLGPFSDPEQILL